MLDEPDVIERALEVFGVGEAGDGCSACVVVSGGDGGGVEVFSDESCGG